LGLLILIRVTDDFRQFVNYSPLFINRKLGVANCVNEQDMGDLKLDLLRNLVRHTDSLRTRYKDTLKSLVDDREQSRPSGNDREAPLGKLLIVIQSVYCF
jgi:hypothetical protein